MANAKDHFALEWIKTDLLEALSEARVSLDAYAEQEDETRLRECLTGLHQVHGTLVMLELKGVSLLADHLEQLAQTMLAGDAPDPGAASQVLMQGILELPGHLEELQRGAADEPGAFVPLVNEIRTHLGSEQLEDKAGSSLVEAPEQEVLERFNAIDGPNKVAKIRSAYQNVLLSILKGEDRRQAVEVLRKIATSLEKVSEGSALSRQWQAFGEFVASLTYQDGALESEAVKLLRRVDLEIKTLVKEGAAALRRPVNVELVQQLLSAAVERDHHSEELEGLQQAVTRDVQNNAMAISGRQAIASAAEALKEDLAVIKDKLDMIVRAGSVDLNELRLLVAPLNTIGTTLSVLGFESSKSIVADQVEAIESLVVLGDDDPQAVQSIASALVQIDENLSSVVQGSEQTEVEQITSDAQLQLLKEARKGLELIKQNVVDFVTTHWDTRHLADTQKTIGEICGALEIVPLTRPVQMLGAVGAYVNDKLMEGHRPEWQELDLFADVVSAIDYYLERLSEDNSAGAEDILAVAERSLQQLESGAATEDDTAAAAAAAEQKDVAAVEESVDEAVAEAQQLRDDLDIPEFVTPEGSDDATPTEAAEPEQDVATEGEQKQEVLDESSVREQEDPELELEADASFDLSSDAFAGIDGAVEEDGPEAATDAMDAAITTEEDSAVEANADVTDDAGLETAELEDAAFAFDEDDATGAAEAPLELDEEPAAEILAEDAAEEPAEGLSAADDADIVFDEPEPEPEPAPEPEAEPEPVMAAEEPARETVVEVEPPDPEIVEIFVEEVDEVLETIDEFLPQWAASLEIGEPLTEVRRSFHTLKGSGRIVQATAIGEVSWAIENMLNRVIDGTVTATAEFAALTNSVREHVPELQQAFAAGNDLGVESVASFIEQADILASGGSIADAPQAAEPEAEAAQDTVSDEMQIAVESEPDALELPEVEDAGLAAEEADIEETEAALPDIEFDLEKLDVGELDASTEPEEEEISAFALFLEEAAEHLAVIELENAAAEWRISEELARAFHTLAGSAAIADAEPVKLIVEPAYQVLEAYREDEPTDALREFFQLAATHLKSCLKALTDKEEWEDPVELVAQADDLLARRDTNVRPVEALLESPAIAAVFGGEDVLEDIFGGNLADQAELVDALSEIGALAGDADAETVRDLALAISATLSRVEPDMVVGNRARVVIKECYEALLDQFNVLAAGGIATPNQGLLDAVTNVELVEPGQPAEVAADSPEVPQDVAQPVQPEETPAEPASAPASAAEPSFDPTDIDPDLVDVFFEEAEELAEEIEGNIVAWSNEHENRIYMENLLRALHTLKGGARLCGLVGLGDMAHDFETLVITVQDGTRPVESGLFSELNNRYDDLVGFISTVKTQLEDSEANVEPAAAAPVEAPVEQREPERAPEPELPVADAPAPVAEPTDSAEVVDLKNEPEEPVSSVNAVLEEFVGQQQETAAPAKPTEAAPPEEAKRSPQEMVRVGSQLLEELVNLAGENSILRARVEQGMSDFTSALDEMESTIERLREQLRRLEIETETQILFRHDRTDGPSYENFDPLEMDRYSQLQQLSRGLSESASDMLDLKETLLYKARESETLLLQQARINTELQEGLMRTRMVPFSRLLPRLRRIVRQVSGELGKDVEFHVQNGEGELDRNLLERMVPPLEHMLRNAVDHGIESADMRRNFGKSPTGRIDLRLTREGGDVVLEISDDGSGVDVESVREKAIERGLMAADANLSDEEVTQFILAAGFSTAKSVTQISGRGVGMDVVHSEVKQLGGSINIVSRAGYGSRFIVRVPFTVSVNRALMVSVSEDLYALPLNTIEGIVLLSPEQLQELYTTEAKTFEYAGIPYRVRYLGQYLGREFNGPAAGQGSVPVVLVRSGDHAVAIHVDAVQGSREIVVKSLGPQFAGVGGISGATILGDGSVVVILDLLALIRAQQHQGVRQKQPSLSQPGRPRCVMVVDDSVTVRKVTSRLLERQGMDVLVAKDGIEAVAMLQERRPDVMLLDIEMPRMDGFEVARQVRHDDRMGNLPIVMISSRTGDKHKEHASELGVNKFLGKPFQENELLATIDELVTR